MGLQNWGSRGAGTGASSGRSRLGKRIHPILKFTDPLPALYLPSAPAVSLCKRQPPSHPGKCPSASPQLCRAYLNAWCLPR